MLTLEEVRIVYHVLSEFRPTPWIGLKSATYSSVCKQANVDDTAPEFISEGVLIKRVTNG